MSETRTIIRYSKAFQQKVVSEIESGKLTIGEAQKIFDINPTSPNFTKDVIIHHIVFLKITHIFRSLTNVMGHYKF